MNITKKIESLSIFVQWGAVDDFLTTTYIITWTNESDPSNIQPNNIQSAAVVEQTTYTTTGLTLDTVYTITVFAANKCGSGLEFVTSISFPADTTSTTSSIISTVITSAHPMTIMSTRNPTTTTDITSTGIAITSNTIATTYTTQLSTTTTTVKMYPSTTTTISMTTTVSRDTDTTSSSSSTTKTTSLMTTTSDKNPSTAVITDPITTTVTSFDMSPMVTANPVDDTGTCKSIVNN